jgi:ribonuclease J
MNQPLSITIHRGARQIGGTCIEVACGGSRIILDAGLPLDADADATSAALNVTGLFDGEVPPVDGLFLSHAHADHSGLISASRGEVPVWMSEGTSKMILAGGLFARQPDVPRTRRRTLVPGKSVKVGAFQITAYPVDHSVYDAMAFLVEAEGKRLLYTGDLRFHGRKPGMARQLAKVAKASPLDALIIEGTRLGVRASEANLSEDDLETQLLGDMRAATGVVLAMYSPLNVDRFVSYFRAARRSHRTFVIDPYQAFVLHLIGEQARVPQTGSTPDLRVLVPPQFSYSRAARRPGHTDWAQGLKNGAITREEIDQAPEKFLVLFRQSMQAWLYPAGLPENVTCIFSYWPGYLREPNPKALIADVKAANGHFLERHASGHAHPDDLRQFVEQVQPRMLVPVHTESPELFQTFFANTRLSPDGQRLHL